MSDDFTVAFPGELATGRVLPPGMVRDLQVVASLEASAINGFTLALSQEAGVLTGERVEDLTKKFFDEAVAESIVRTIQSVLPEEKQKILALVGRWRQVSDEGMQLLPDTEFAALQHNFDSLVQDYPGVALMRKAQRLLRDTGNEIEDSIFICDLRPVFDEPKEQVEGFVALANLRIKYICQSGNRDAFEVALTEDELSALVEQGQQALNKLNVLKEAARGLLK